MTSATYSNSEAWSTAADLYVSYAAFATVVPTERLVTMTHKVSPFSPSESCVLDNGAGTGVLTKALIDRFPGVKVLGTDIAPAMLAELVKERLPNITPKVMDAFVENGSLADETFSYVMSIFMVQFTPDPMFVVREMYKLLRRGGVIRLGKWVSVAINLPWEEVCRELDPEFVPASAFDESAWRTEEDVGNALEGVAFEEVENERTRMRKRFENEGEYVDYWFKAKNPGVVKMRGAWKGDVEEVRGTLERRGKER